MYTRNLRSLWAGLLLALAMPAAFAQTEVPLGAAGSGPLTGLTTFLQEVIDFMSGPWAIFVLAGGIVAAVCLWMWAPRENGAMSGVFRAVMGGVMILNAGGFVAWLAGFAT